MQHASKATICMLGELCIQPALRGWTRLVTVECLESVGTCLNCTKCRYRLTVLLVLLTVGGAACELTQVSLPMPQAPQPVILAGPQPRQACRS